MSNLFPNHEEADQLIAASEQITQVNGIPVSLIQAHAVSCGPMNAYDAAANLMEIAEEEEECHRFEEALATFEPEEIDYEDVDCKDCGLKFFVDPALYTEEANEKRVEEGLPPKEWPTQCPRCQKGLPPKYEY